MITHDARRSLPRGNNPVPSPRLATFPAALTAATTHAHANSGRCLPGCLCTGLYAVNTSGIMSIQSCRLRRSRAESGASRRPPGKDGRAVLRVVRTSSANCRKQQIGRPKPGARGHEKVPVWGQARGPRWWPVKSPISRSPCLPGVQPAPAFPAISSSGPPRTTPTQRPGRRPQRLIWAQDAPSTCAPRQPDWAPRNS
jgi:hypothetical protein